MSKGRKDITFGPDSTISALGHGVMWFLNTCSTFSFFLSKSIQKAMLLFGTKR